MIFSVFMETDAHTFWDDKGLRAQLKKKKTLKKSGSCERSSVSALILLSPWGAAFHVSPCAGGREKRSSEPWIEDVLALLRHQGRRTFALLSIAAVEERQQVEFE